MSVVRRGAVGADVVAVARWPGRPTGPGSRCWARAPRPCRRRRRRPGRGRSSARPGSCRPRAGAPPRPGCRPAARPRPARRGPPAGGPAAEPVVGAARRHPQNTRSTTACETPHGPQVVVDHLVGLPRPGSRSTPPPPPAPGRRAAAGRAGRPRTSMIALRTRLTSRQAAASVVGVLAGSAGRRRPPPRAPPGSGWCAALDAAGVPHLEQLHGPLDVGEPAAAELEVGGRVGAARQPLGVDARLDPAHLDDVVVG